MTDVILSSGGLDSAVIAAVNPDAIHLHTYYGQRNAGMERLASGDVAAHYGAEWCTVALTGFAVLAPSTLTGQSGDLVGAPTVVPNRNAMLISLGVALALSRGGGTVLIGCNANDWATYPDCRPEFIAAAHQLAQVATDGLVHVDAPLLHLTKPEIGQLATARRIPLNFTWSCYAAGPVPCGDCGACAERKAALGVHDH